MCCLLYPSLSLPPPLSCPPPPPQVGAVQQLLQAGADRDVQDIEGKMPVDLATTLGHHGVVTLLAGGTISKEGGGREGRKGEEEGEGEGKGREREGRGREGEEREGRGRGERGKGRERRGEGGERGSGSSFYSSLDIYFIMQRIFLIVNFLKLSVKVGHGIEGCDLTFDLCSDAFPRQCEQGFGSADRETQHGQHRG